MSESLYKLSENVSSLSQAVEKNTAASNMQQQHYMSAFDENGCVFAFWQLQYATTRAKPLMYHAKNEMF